MITQNMSYQMLKSNSFALFFTMVKRPSSHRIQKTTTLTILGILAIVAAVGAVGILTSISVVQEADAKARCHGSQGAAGCNKHAFFGGEICNKAHGGQCHDLPNN